MIYRIGDASPSIAASAFVAADATVIGRVHLAESSSVWFQAVLRGDMEPIRIGEESNIQDGSVLHTDAGFPLVIGRGVTVGHRVVLHGCRIEDHALIGINSVILNGAVIGRESLIGANALVTEGKVIPERSLVIGSPARVVRSLTTTELAGLRHSAEHYVDNARRYLKELAEV